MNYGVDASRWGDQYAQQQGGPLTDIYNAHRNIENGFDDSWNTQRYPRNEGVLIPNGNDRLWSIGTGENWYDPSEWSFHTAFERLLVGDAPPPNRWDDTGSLSGEEAQRAIYASVAVDAPTPATQPATQPTTRPAGSSDPFPWMNDDSLYLGYGSPNDLAGTSTQGYSFDAPVGANTASPANAPSANPSSAQWGTSWMASLPAAQSTSADSPTYISDADLQRLVASVRSSSSLAGSLRSDAPISIYGSNPGISSTILGNADWGCINPWADLNEYDKEMCVARQQDYLDRERRDLGLSWISRLFPNRDVDVQIKQDQAVMWSEPTSTPDRLSPAPEPSWYDYLDGGKSIINNGTANAIDGPINTLTGFAWRATHRSVNDPNVTGSASDWAISPANSFGAWWGSTDRVTANRAYGVGFTNNAIVATTNINGLILGAAAGELLVPSLVSVPRTAVTAVPDLSETTFFPASAGRAIPRAPYAADFYDKLIASLPTYDASVGRTTGILVTDEGLIFRFQSGDPAPAFANYRIASHVEGKSAIQIGTGNSTGGIVFHNYPNGTCGWCYTGTPTLLPAGTSLDIIPAASNWNAVPVRGLYNYPVIRTGNAKLPLLNRGLGPGIE